MTFLLTKEKENMNIYANNLVIPFCLVLDNNFEILCCNGLYSKWENQPVDLSATKDRNVNNLYFIYIN